MGAVRVFKSGRMMFKHKNKFFHVQKHYLFIIFKFFIFLGVKLVDAGGHSCVLQQGRSQPLPPDRTGSLRGAGGLSERWGVS